MSLLDGNNQMKRKTPNRADMYANKAYRNCIYAIAWTIHLDPAAFQVVTIELHCNPVCYNMDLSITLITTCVPKPNHQRHCEVEYMVIVLKLY